MYKYYLFLIKEEYLYEPEYLIYKIMENLFQLKINNLNYGISCYNQLCDNFNVPILSNYLINKFENHILIRSNYKYIIKINDERYIIKLGLKFIVIVSNKNNPTIFRYLKCYNHKIFVCDFHHHEYFWLHKQHSNMGNKTYI